MNLWEMADLKLPWSLRVVVTLRVADHMAAGISDIHALAAAAECDAEVLSMVLEFLVERGVFEKSETGRFLMNEESKGLLDPGLRLGLDLNGIGGRMAGAWATLPTYVRTGTPAYKDAFGLPFWEDLDAHPEIGASFDAMMGPAGHGECNGEFEIEGGWERVRTVVDVGGGTGAMLAAILRLRPKVHGILVDLPKTAERAADTFHIEGLEDRVTRVGQSFFDPLPAGADLYLLRKVINNWSDAEAVSILRRCADAAGPNGRIVILKGVGPDGSLSSLSESSVIVGGKDRSIAEFRPLADQCGLAVVQARQQSSGDFVVECRAV